MYGRTESLASNNPIKYYPRNSPKHINDIISLRVLKSLPQQTVRKPVVLIATAHPDFKKATEWKYYRIES